MLKILRPEKKEVDILLIHTGDEVSITTSAGVIRISLEKGFGNRDIAMITYKEGFECQNPISPPE